MSVYYKFNSELNYSYVDFDGLHISVSDLKKAILHQKRLGKSADFDLLISNAQTKEEYKDEHGLIPKNTSLIVARIPISNQNKKSWELAQNSAERAPQNQAPENVNHDITRMNGSEEDKIQAMMMQSAGDYDPTNYQRVRGSTQTGEVPSNYRCHKCNKPGHWIKNCPLNIPGKEHHHFKTRPESKKMTGIPRSLRDNIGAETLEPTQNVFIEEKREIPEDLICSICKGIFKDAVMIPCCGSSFCDECVRTALLESEDNECPDCKEKGTSPGSLIPNRFLRNAVVAFYAESSNVMVRDNPKKALEEPLTQENFEELMEEDPMEPVTQIEPEKVQNYINTEDINEKDDENMVQLNLSAEKDSESEDDDDNITVTVPPAHQQSRGNAFRDSRLRRVTSHGMSDYHESYPHSSRNHHDDDEPYEEENSDSYIQRGSKHHNYEHSSSSSQPQGISTLVGDDKSGSQNLYRSSSSSSVSNQNMPPSDSQNVYQQHQQQPPPIYNQNHSGMMPQMHSHSMYPQGHYHQPSGPYYPANQIRPMRFEHQGNYQVPMRHHHPSQMMRPSMHENFNMRHQRPPINHLANAVTHNIQQRYGTGIIDDPLEAFNRIMREKELRKERYRRSPLHNSDRRSRSFERKRSPVHPYSPDSRRPKNYSKARKRSRSFKSNSSKSYSRSRSRSRNRSTRGRSKSRSYSPRYRRKENIQSKDRRDERHRSPPRRGGNHHNSRSSRGSYKNEQPYKQGLRDPQDNHQYHDNVGNQHEKIDQVFDYQKDVNIFEAPHSLDEQPPPPGDDAELLNLHVMPATIEKEAQEKNDSSKTNDAPKDLVETNGSHRTDVDTKRTEQELKKSDHHHHHHKKSSRSKNYETSSDDKKVRDKKKQKKSREHEKKKSKKDRKVRSEKEKDKIPSSKAGSKERSPEPTSTVQAEHVEADSTEDKLQAQEIINENMMEDEHEPVEVDAAAVQVKSTVDAKLKRSDSFLDINPNVDLDLDEWITPEVSKWERDENKSLDNSEADIGNTELKKNPEEKVTSEILKRAENAIFARAISAIRPMENKKVRVVQEQDSGNGRKETSPITSVAKKAESGKDSKINAYQVTVPVNETGARSVELKSSETSRKKSPMKSSIKNRLGIKIIEKKSRSRTPSRSPKRRLQSDCTKVVRSSRDGGPRPRTERPGRERYSSTENRRNKQMSSFIKVSHDTKDVSHNNRSRYNDKRRSPTPDSKKPVKRYRTSRSRSKSRHNVRRHDQRSNAEKSSGRSRELPTRSDDKSSKIADQSLSDNEKAKAKSSREAEPLIKKRSRDSSSSSTSSSVSSNESQKPSKRHGKHKVKKKSRSLSVESNSNSKRKKSKKDKKAKKKKKSRK